MGGLAGLIDPTGAPIDPAILERMTATLAPRGPDAEGFWYGAGVGLGHRRLKVIDMSEGGGQPMADARGQVRVVFDGEIYNFLDLRAELMAQGHAFRSLSDTEVLLAAYLEWGDDVASHLEGAFAFVIWDGRLRRAFAARGPTGEKPLYFARVARTGGMPAWFAFASELKALMTVPNIDRSVRIAALERYLTIGFVPAPLTIINGADKLEAGETLTVTLSAETAETHAKQQACSTPAERHVRMGMDDAAEALWSLLRRAVERRLIADVPLGIWLADGIASSAVAAAMHDVLGGGQNMLSFAIATSPAPLGEAGAGGGLASHWGCRHHELDADQQTVIAALPQVARLLDEPIADPAVVLTYLLSQFTRRTVTAVLTGDRSDHVWLPTPEARWQKWRRLCRRIVPSARQRLLLHRVGPSSASLVGSDCAQGNVELVTTRLDRAAGAVGLEVRAPMFDSDLLQFARMIPSQLRRDGGALLLQRMLQRRLPPQLLQRHSAKTNGLPRVGHWLTGELLPLLRDELAPHKLTREGVFDPVAVKSLIDDHVSGRRDGGMMLWTLLTFQRWRAEYGPAS